MPGDDLTTKNVPFNPIHPEISEKPASSKTSINPIDSVISAFKEMKETATEGTQQFRALFKKSPSDFSFSDLKIGQAVTSFFSKSIPEFGEKLLDQAGNLKEKVNNFVNKDKKYEAEHNKYLPAWAAGGEEKLSAKEKLDQIARPITRKISELSEHTKPALATIAEKVETLRDLIPSFSVSTFADAGDDLAIHLDMESVAPRRDIKEEMPAFLNDVADLKPVKFDEAYKERMQASHKALNKELSITQDSSRKIVYDVGSSSMDAWKMKSVDKKKTYNLNQVQVKGSTLNGLMEKTRVTYDKNVVDPETLSSILANGAKNHTEQVKASGRCIVSTDILTQDNNGLIRPNDRDNPKTFQTYTINAPNLNYNPEIKKMMTVDGKIDMGLWQKEMTRLLTHVLKEAQKDNLEMIVIPAIGMGVFMPDDPKELKIEAKQVFYNALIAAKKAAGAEALEVVVTGKEMEGVISKDERVHIVGSKDAFGVLGLAIDKNFRAGLINAGDPSGQTGQYANLETPNHIALEEGLVINAPTVRLNQNPNANKKVLDTSRYIAT